MKRNRAFLHALDRSLSVIIFLLLVFVCGYFFMKIGQARKKMSLNPGWPPVKPALRRPQNILLVPDPQLDVNFTNEELSDAIEFLNIPTWSRGYVHCSNPESEVTCSQVVHAYRIIKGWEDHIAKIPLDERKYFVIKHPIKGMGNKMTTDINGFTMALMSNRSVLVISNYPSRNGLVLEHAYKYPPSVLTSVNQLPESLQKNANDFVNIPTDIRWSCYDVKNRLLGDDQFVGMSDLLYGSMIYANKDTSIYARENFGIHAAYFVGNYFSRFPESSIKVAHDILSQVPPDKTVLGFHIRYHRAGQYYSHGFNQTMPIVYDEIDRRIAESKNSDKPDIVLAVSTDNLEIKRMMIERYGDRVLMTDALRKPDKDHQSAQDDMALILGSDEIYATYRSTFSWIIVSKSGKRAWWIEKEAPHWFPSMNSQTGCISMIYHWRDHCDWRTNDRIKYCGKEHRKSLEYFYDYLVL